MAGSLRSEVLDRARAEAYRGTFAASLPLGEHLPPGWEGLYFPFDTSLAGLREDGSPAEELPAGLPLRRYAGEDTEIVAPLRFGATAGQEVRTGRPVAKDGRSGRLVFVAVERDYVVDGAVAVRSVWHDVFLEGPVPASAPATDETAWDLEEPLRLDARQLFRFSALTFNTHRVHYDRDWARDVEGLPGLLVHGPLVRLLLLDLAGRVAPGRPVRRTSVRMQGPVHVDTDYRLAARGTAAGLELAVLGARCERLATSTVDFTVEFTVELGELT